ncbi:DUF2817 domain-containing protein [Pseudovibrio sp. SPO723]|uniref:DUF2817 domain-containing protein n=1 Tax=Nesiotobacter zosterae TaxID=392721 RepID=UPI0029C4D9C0|nr:DUF2817 domain-containing protein [Pseudovibrio sp. SPO723]MDX5595729.1 DUF2817 domain-containing protein [Pseudovibrio sp. SPO723]
MLYSSWFSKDFFEAQSRFDATCSAKGLPLENLAYRGFKSLSGPVRTLVARLGPDNARKRLFIMSGVHGTELTAGSGLQLFLLHKYADERPRDIQLIFIHAINPAGAVLLTRTDETNVDPNRNYRDFTAPLPSNKDYAELHRAICTDAIEGPERAVQEAPLLQYIEENGISALTQRVLKGQHTHPMGLFYGGTHKTAPARTLEEILQGYAASTDHATMIDLHTGLGAQGDLELIALHNTREPEGTTSLIDGLMANAMDQLPLKTKPRKYIYEFGTKPFWDVLEAHRRDNWLKRNPYVADDKAQAIKNQLKRALFIDKEDWCHSIIKHTENTTDKILADLKAL